MTPVPALVTWAGRLPAGLKYSTLAKFAEDKNWPDRGWSVVLEFDRPPAELGSPSPGVVRFLMEDAPHDRLRPGCKFELFAGSAKVADVEILAAGEE